MEKEMNTNMALKEIGSSFICISLFAILLRLAVSLHPYSGAGDPPKYGDFEAQRHWMEITLNLPSKDWYRNSTTNDLAYWGLDYPPLTAYQSYIHGLLIRSFHPDLVSLYASRGHESYLGKLLMRWTVLSSDVLIFFPAVLYFIIAYYASQLKRVKSNVSWHIAMILLSPCLVLIDHGHFQYNCISLGLTLGAVAAILSNNELYASFLFTLALNHKQMSAYFAPAFFSHLFGKCLRRRNPLLEVSKLGLVVLGTFALVWWPYLHSLDAVLEEAMLKWPPKKLPAFHIGERVEAVDYCDGTLLSGGWMNVLSRLAPFERGIFEDYVANLWCTTSVLIKWKILFTPQSLKLLSLALTVFSCLPSMIRQIQAPTNQTFLYGLLNCSFSFYLFSFQVHEKSILLPLLPASLLAFEEPRLFQWLTQYALLSMFPLLCRDKLVITYIAMYAIFTLVYYFPDGRPKTKIRSHPPWKLFIRSCLLLCSLSLHIIYLTVTPPKKYPYLFEAVIMLLCFSQFVLVAVYSNVKLWTLSKQSTVSHNMKKHM